MTAACFYLDPVNRIPKILPIERVCEDKAYVIGGALGTLLVANLGTYYVLSKWCQNTDGPTGGGLSCYNGGDHNHAAARLRPTNIATGIGVVAVYAYGVADGLWGYRRLARARTLAPFVDTTAERQVFGVAGRF